MLNELYCRGRKVERTAHTQAGRLISGLIPRTPLQALMRATLGGWNQDRCSVGPPATFQLLIAMPNRPRAGNEAKCLH